MVARHGPRPATFQSVANGASHRSFSPTNNTATPVTPSPTAQRASGAPPTRDTVGNRSTSIDPLDAEEFVEADRDAGRLADGLDRHQHAGHERRSVGGVVANSERLTGRPEQYLL